jgi:hypothetical protein
VTGVKSGLPAKFGRDLTKREKQKFTIYNSLTLVTGRFCGHGTRLALRRPCVRIQFRVKLVATLLAFTNDVVNVCSVHVPAGILVVMHVPTYICTYICTYVDMNWMKMKWNAALRNNVEVQVAESQNVEKYSKCWFLDPPDSQRRVKSLTLGVRPLSIRLVQVRVREGKLLMSLYTLKSTIYVCKVYNLNFDILSFGIVDFDKNRSTTLWVELYYIRYIIIVTNIRIILYSYRLVKEPFLPNKFVSQNRSKTHNV